MLRSCLSLRVSSAFLGIIQWSLSMEVRESEMGVCIWDSYWAIKSSAWNVLADPNWINVSKERLIVEKCYA